MGKLLFTAVIVLSLGLVGVAQQGGYGFGGFMLGWLMLDLAETNAVLETAGYPALGERILVMGGGGGGGPLRGIALGGMGFSGTADAVQGGRSVELELGFGGVTLEWMEKAADRALIGMGVVLGGGSATLTARSRFAEDMEDALTSPTTTHLSAGFFGGMGVLRLQLGIAEWLWLDGWAGYMIGFPGRWQEDDRPLAGPSVPARGPFFGIGLSFGGVGVSVPEPEVREEIRRVDPTEPRVPPDERPVVEPEPDDEEVEEEEVDPESPQEEDD